MLVYIKLLAMSLHDLFTYRHTHKAKQRVKNNEG